MECPIIRVIPQRYDGDCSVACLAMLLGVPYENALVAAAQVAPNVCMTGMWIKHLEAAALLLGYKLRRRRRFDIETDTGILVVGYPKRLKHVVVLREGLVIETDGCIWESELYMKQHQATAGPLLVAEATGE